ncbi:MAG TPA: glycosyltransferase [Armatimonadota bacterium]|jgi:glycosyltransferase involved in cell wall biosynthesis
MKISVCMAAYNGGDHILTQVGSILKQLGPHDELIVVDDCSRDDTVAALRSLHDPRIRLVCQSVNKGVVSTFNKALALATGEVVFLSDQDDLWMDHKVEAVLEIFRTKPVDVVVHDAVVMEGQQVVAPSLFAMRHSGPGALKNLVSNTCVGCCMAFRTEVLRSLLPVPVRRGVMHDSWIGILGAAYGFRFQFLPVPLIEFRRHGGNASTLRTRPIFRILGDRLVLVLWLAGRYLATLGGRGARPQALRKTGSPG